MKEATLPASTWPWMPAPSGPNRSGSFSTPAPKMAGVASRNANRAASTWDSPL
jgi:hypothetical protein